MEALGLIPWLDYSEVNSVAADVVDMLIVPELGPCNVTAQLQTHLNAYSWNEVSNMLFISQPVGVGFSYSEETDRYLNTSTREGGDQGFVASGRWPTMDADSLSTSDAAAVGVWHILQGFFDALPQLDGRVKSKTFNLWTNSYGGHYGPSFFKYFYEENQKIDEGCRNGTKVSTFRLVKFIP